MKNLAIFVSGSGTNCENIIRYFKKKSKKEVNIALVLASKSGISAIDKAQHFGVETIVVGKEDFNNPGKLLPLLDKYHIDFIVLAGFLRIIPDFLINQYDHRIINIHPALLPKFGGKGMYGHHVHEAVKAAGEKKTGMTVHWVSNICDGGEIIAQYETAISPDDTPEDIAAKEHLLEIKYYPEVIERLL